MADIGKKGLESKIGMQGRVKEHEGILSKDERGYFLQKEDSKFYLKPGQRIGFMGGFLTERFYYHKIRFGRRRKNYWESYFGS